MNKEEDRIILRKGLKEIRDKIRKANEEKIEAEENEKHKSEKIRKRDYCSKTNVRTKDIERVKKEDVEIIEEVKRLENKLRKEKEYKQEYEKDLKK